MLCKVLLLRLRLPPCTGCVVVSVWAAGDMDAGFNAVGGLSDSRTCDEGAAAVVDALSAAFSTFAVFVVLEDMSVISISFVLSLVLSLVLVLLLSLVLLLVLLLFCAAPIRCVVVRPCALAAARYFALVPLLMYHLKMMKVGSVNTQKINMPTSDHKV